jgi:hypothetical protein
MDWDGGRERGWRRVSRRAGKGAENFEHRTLNFEGMKKEEWSHG